jgi:hypothetical protein
MLVDLTGYFPRHSGAIEPLRASRFVVAQVAARGLCGPRPEAFARFHRPAIRPASIVNREICTEQVFENEHLHKNGVGVPQQFIETQSYR